MDLPSFNRTNKPSREQMVMISDRLIQELASALGLKLLCFKRDIVEGESVVSTVQGTMDVSEMFEFSFEAAILVQMRTDQPPNINAEVLMFSRDERVGLHRNNGRSYLLCDFDCTQDPAHWTTQGWINDGPDDWERMARPRSNLYNRLDESWEDND
ncbi:MAG: hypothetical protein CMJ48_06760 [Planctomycetaceae bacterium]|nr:hypothetical protein [Planctomycetaceae bacterium]